MTTNISHSDSALLLAKQNDHFRKNVIMRSAPYILHHPIDSWNEYDACLDHSLMGRFLLTRGINGMEETDQYQILKRVVEFNSFTPDNDPYGEHDFGSFIYKGEKIFWKIDYYDLNYQYGSPNPKDQAVTRRLLTVMTSSEY